MTRKDKELKLIHAFGLNIGDTLQYKDYLGNEYTTRIVECDDKLMLDNGDVIENILVVSYGWNHYKLDGLSRKARERIALKLLDIHFDDKIKHNGTIYTCREFGDDITLYNSGECWPVHNLFRLDNWEKV